MQLKKEEGGPSGAESAGSGSPGRHSAGLGELLARLEAAEAGSRELDARMWLAGEGREFSHISVEKLPYTAATPAFANATNKTSIRLSHIPEVTASLDAAVSLAERLLPGWLWSAGNLSQGGHAYLMRAKGAALIGGKAKTVPLALCIALVRALSGREGGEDE